LVASWTIDRAEQVARAFTCYFQLVNLAEDRHRARALRERDRGTEPLSESLAEAVAEIRSRHGDERVRELLRNLVIQPVLTAHPTVVSSAKPGGACSRRSTCCGERHSCAALNCSPWTKCVP
jgi:phosphoenolpyruvate carboxylase